MSGKSPKTMVEESVFNIQYPKSDLKPFVKWPGGKSKELDIIWTHLPSKIERFFEPFVGGGAVYFGMPDTIQKFYINDKSQNLVNLYLYIQSKSPMFLKALFELNEDWKELASLFNGGWYTSLLNKFEELRRIKAQDLDNVHFTENVRAWRVEVVKTIKEFELSFLRMKQNKEWFILTLTSVVPQKLLTISRNEEKQKNRLSESDLKDMLLTAIKQSYYDYIRLLLNDESLEKTDTYTYAAVYYFIRMFCYSSMFRYNGSGKFNVPYGGKSYNTNSFDEKLKLIQCDEYHVRLKKTIIYQGEFDDFLEQFNPSDNDFIFLDPPYDSEFSTYEQNSFAGEQQERLAKFLIKYFPNQYSEVYPKWMMVIKNTEFISGLYASDEAKRAGIVIKGFDKNYAVSFMNRNDQSVQHLIITNYQTSPDEKSPLEEVEQQNSVSSICNAFKN